MTRNKFNARKCEADGITFDSLAERNMYWALQARQADDEIYDLTRQPKFELQPAFTTSEGERVAAITYTPDFAYKDALSLEQVVVEVKGGKATMTQASRLRIKLFQYRYQDIRFELWEA